MTTQLANRHVAPDAEWTLPTEPAEGIGIIFPSCTDHSDPIEVPVTTSRMLRQGSEAELCFRCGPDGSVYHPDPDHTMLQVETVAAWLTFSPEALRLAAER